MGFSPVVVLLLLGVNTGHARGPKVIFLATETSRLVVDLDFSGVYQDTNKLDTAMAKYRALEFESGVKTATGQTSGLIWDKMIKSYSKNIMVRWTEILSFKLF